MSRSQKKFSKPGRNVLLISVLALGAMVVTSCATLQAPASPPSFPQQELLRQNREGIDIAVKPVVGEDEYLQLFDENLPQSGIVALWVTVHNTRAAPIELHPTSWCLRVAGQSFPAMSISELFKRFYEANHVRMYSLETDRTARLNMDRLALQQGQIPPSVKREGFTFFRIDPSLISSWNSRASLWARDIRLNPHAVIALEIALSHARP